jgi:hypothetical protein
MTAQDLVVTPVMEAENVGQGGVGGTDGADSPKLRLGGNEMSFRFDSGELCRMYHIVNLN